ncbi:MAG: hypothetical protein M0Z28_30045 [Rhodospirillales bacterium]|nr:hypothetical protein [Rhodospirillales bacterium]
MVRVRLTIAAAGLLAAAPVLAQTDTQAPPQHILGTLPASPTSPTTAAPAATGTPQDFIQTALHALAAGRTAEAENAIEQAESRVLTRSIKPSLANQPSQQSLVQQLGQARQALAAGDRLQAVRILEVAANNPEAADK